MFFQRRSCNIEQEALACRERLLNIYRQADGSMTKASLKSGQKDICDLFDKLNVQKWAPEAQRDLLRQILPAYGTPTGEEAYLRRVCGLKIRPNPNFCRSSFFKPDTVMQKIVFPWIQEALDSRQLLSMLVYKQELGINQSYTKEYLQKLQEAKQTLLEIEGPLGRGVNELIAAADRAFAQAKVQLSADINALSGHASLEYWKIFLMQLNLDLQIWHPAEKLQISPHSLMEGTLEQQTLHDMGELLARIFYLHNYLPTPKFSIVDCSGFLFLTESQFKKNMSNLLYKHAGEVLFLNNFDVLINKIWGSHEITNKRSLAAFLSEVLNTSKLVLVVQVSSGWRDFLEANDSLKRQLARRVKIVSNENRQRLRLALEDMNQLIGCRSVKESLNTIVSDVSLRRQQQAMGIEIPLENGCLHTAFLGNPGTGKTTVARIYARILHGLELVKSSRIFIEANRSDLVGEYVGHTAPKTKAICQQALGGVLFIDEAYLLAPLSQNDFGYEAIGTLLTFMENHRDNFVVILAGYSREMGQLFATNSGLSGRIPQHVNFEDFDNQELQQILEFEITKNRLRVDMVTVSRVARNIASRRGSRDFANARDVRTCIEQALRRKNRRLQQQQTNTRFLAREQMQTLIASDFGLENNNLFDI